jgi:hypothetical protein
VGKLYDDYFVKPSVSVPRGVVTPELRERVTKPVTKLARPVTKSKAGRKQVYETGAARQAAYRERKRARG